MGFRKYMVTTPKRVKGQVNAHQALNDLLEKFCFWLDSGRPYIDFYLL
jgi:hypothetical protein